MMRVVTQLPHLSLFCASRDIQYRSVILLRHVYVGDSELSFVDTLYQHFKHCSVDIVGKFYSFFPVFYSCTSVANKGIYMVCVSVRVRACVCECVMLDSFPRVLKCELKSACISNWRK
jgi:hypothetical protein